VGNFTANGQVAPAGRASTLHGPLPVLIPTSVCCRAPLRWALNARRDRAEGQPPAHQVGRAGRGLRRHADLFAELFGALLGEAVSFDAPTEKWIVWPAAAPGGGADPRTSELLEWRIRIASYVLVDACYSFVVGSGVTPSRAQAAGMTLRIGSTGDPRIAALAPIGGVRDSRRTRVRLKADRRSS
jgi:hypothetical protein